MHRLSCELKIKTTITKEELNKAKTQLKASLMMGLESSSTRMERLANQYIHHGKITSPSEIVAQIDRISIDSLKEVANNIFRSKPTLAIIGKGKDSEKLHEIF